MGRIALMIALGGCDVVFGIHQVGDPQPAPDAPDMPQLITGTYTQRYLENLSDGTPTPRSRTPSASQITPSVRLDSGKAPIITFDAGNLSFYVDNPGQHYTLDMRSQFSDVEFQLTADSLVLGERFPGHIDRTPVPAGTAIALAVNARQNIAGSGEDLLTSGLWTRQSIKTLNNKDFTVDWATTTIPGGTIGLLEGGKFDDIWYAHYSPTPATGVIQLDAWAEVTNTSLAPMTMNPFIVGFAQNTAYPNCTHLTASLHAEAQRVASANGASTASVYYGVHYVPEREFITSASFPLAWHGTFAEVPADTIVDVDASLDYNQPYPGGEAYGVVAVNSFSKLPFISVTSVGPVHQSCTAATAIATGNVEIASDVTVAGLALTTNDVPAALPSSSFVDIAWNVGTRRVDYWIVHVQQVVSTTFTPEVVTIVTQSSPVKLDTAKLIDGYTYRLQVVGLTGYANVNMGDFLTLSANAMLSVVTPGTFVVTLE